MISHLIFDFDGTIVDNFDLVHKLVVNSLAESGIKITKTKNQLKQQGVKASIVYNITTPAQHL